MVSSILLLGIILPVQQVSVGTVQDVFVSRVLDSSQPFEVVRIPALSVTSKGTVLAFAEGRKSIDDQSSNVIILRRKVAGSSIWTDTKVILADKPASLNNPCVLVVGNTITMMYQRYPLGMNERTTMQNYEPEEACRSFVVTSTDDAKTWSKPRELTRIIKGPNIQSVASGPGVGIRLQSGNHKGRWLFPFNEGANGNYDVFAVYSDDQGKTWERGIHAPKMPGLQPNEVQFVELQNGDVHLNARNQASGKFRLSATSRDGGGTWSTARPDPDLIDPVCMGSILRVSTKPSLWVFTNAADTTRRVNGTLRFSANDGHSWSLGATLERGRFEYSSCALLAPGILGVLYEVPDVNAAGKQGYRIRFVEVKFSTKN